VAAASRSGAGQPLPPIDRKAARRRSAVACAFAHTAGASRAGAETTLPETKAGQPLPGIGQEQPLPPIDGKPPVVGQPSPTPSPTLPAPHGPAPKSTLPEPKPDSRCQEQADNRCPPVSGKPPVAGQPQPAGTTAGNHRLPRGPRQRLRCPKPKADSRCQNLASHRCHRRTRGPPIADQPLSGRKLKPKTPSAVAPLTAPPARPTC